MDLSQTWTYDCYLKKFGPNYPDIYPHGKVTKSRFWDRLWTLTEHISAMEHDINNRKETFNRQGLPYRLPKFGELWSRNG